MNVIATLTIFFLIIMRLFHFYWAFGGEVGLDRALPTKEGRRLINPGKLLFLMRAVGDFNAVGFFKKIRSTAFAAYDTKYFSPLCVYLSVAFALLSYEA